MFAMSNQYILCKQPCDESQKCLPDKPWSNFCKVTERWAGIDRFDDVFATLDWESGAN